MVFISTGNSFNKIIGAIIGSAVIIVILIIILIVVIVIIKKYEFIDQWLH